MNARHLVPVAILASMSALTTACSIGEDDLVSPEVEVIDRTKGAITASGLAQINGEYSNCSGHTDGDPWSVKIAAPSVTNQLTVRKNDVNCRLILTEVVNGSTTYDTPSDIEMGTSFKVAGSAFSNGGTLAFYGNAKQSSLLYTGNFGITLLISDEPTTGSDQQTAGFATVQESSVSASNVTSPGYSASLASFGVGSGVDDVITDLSGYLALSLAEGAQAGEKYVITSTDLSSPTFASVDAAYNAGSDVDMPVDGQIAASEFGDLIGADLTEAPAKRWVIVMHEADGVRSFQVFTLTFNKVGGYN